MALLRVGDAAVEALLGQPESGLGYQIVRHCAEAYVVFNATVAISLRELREEQLSDSDYELLSGDPAGENVKSAGLWDVDRGLQVVYSSFEGGEIADEFGLSFAETVIRPSDSAVPSQVPRSYYRYSPYSKDRRVTADGNFLPGTYATTYSDMHFVPSGYAAVGRFALPSPASARYLFSIVTCKVPSLMGTAAPNFGQAGGGVEVYFDSGANHCPGTSFPIEVG